MKYYLGIDIGGTKTAVCLWNSVPKKIDKIIFSTKVERGYKAIIDEIILTIETIMMRNNVFSDDVISGGISCGGPLDSKSGIIKCPPNLPDWDNVKITDILERVFSVKFYLQNDANACALAEWKYGAAKGYNNVVFLTFGTGMGAGIILDGRLYSGTCDCAGEVGHIRLSDEGPIGYGKYGSFEGFCSGGGIADFARKAARDYLDSDKSTILASSYDDIDKITAKSVAEAAYNGDELAIDIYKTCGKMLGKGLSVIIDILNPEVIVIGSIYARSNDLLCDTMNEEIKKESLPCNAACCKIVPAELGDEIGDYAAVGVAQNN